MGKIPGMTSGDITCKGNFSIFILLRAMQKLFMLSSTPQKHDWLLKWNTKTFCMISADLTNRKRQTQKKFWGTVPKKPKKSQHHEYPKDRENVTWETLAQPSLVSLINRPRFCPSQIVCNDVWTKKRSLGSCCLLFLILLLLRLMHARSPFG